MATYHREDLSLEGQANRPPAIGAFLAAVLWLLGNRPPSDAGGAELGLLERAGGRADAAGAACAGPRPAGRLGALRTLLCHLQRRLRLAGVGQRRLNVGGRLAGRRHGGHGAASEDPGAGADGDGGRAVAVAEA